MCRGLLCSQEDEIDMFEGNRRIPAVLAVTVNVVNIAGI